MAASAYHSYAFAVSRTSGVFYSDDRRVAEDFGVSPTTIFSLRTWLEDQGWLVPIDKKTERQRNRVTGHWLPFRYRVLSHAEWVATHPGKCRFLKSDTQPPVPDSVAGPATESVAGDQAPVTDSGAASYSFAQSPVTDSGTKIVDSRLYREKEKKEQTSAAQPAAPEVPDISFPDWWPVEQWNEFLKYRKARKKLLTPYAQQLAIKTLAQIRADGFDPAAAIDRSILNGWLGFFPPTGSRGHGFTNPAGRTTEDHAQRMRKNAKTLGLDGSTRFERNMHAAGLPAPEIKFVTSEFGPRKTRDPETQAAIEEIYRKFKKENP
jgi:hypothetical protein